MFESLQKSITGLITGQRKESFTNHSGDIVVVETMSTGELLSFLLVLFLYFAIVAAVGMYLWNKCAVKLVSIAKPATSMWQVLGLLILTQLLFN